MSNTPHRAGPLAVLMLCAATAAAQTAPPAAEAITVRSIRGGLHLLGGAGGNVVVWTGPDGVVVVDSGTGARAAELAAAVQDLATGPVRFVVNTHWHPDHVGGNAVLARGGATVVAHDAVRVRMSERQRVAEYQLEVPPAAADALPSLTFDDTLTLHANGDVLQLLHVAGAHSDGDVVAWWEGADVVYVGDVYYAGGYPFVDRASGGSLAALLVAVETVLSRAGPDTVIVPGHGPLSNRAEFAAYRDMLVAVGRRMRELTEQGRSVDDVLDARPTAAYDERYGQGGLSAERFVRILYEDLARR